MSQQAKAVVHALRQKKAKKEIDLFEGKKAQAELQQEKAYYEYLDEKDKDFDPEVSSEEEEESSDEEELYEDGFRVKDTEEQPLTQEESEEEELSSEEDESSEEEEIPEEVVAKLPPREKILRSRAVPIPYKVKTQTKYYAPDGQEIKPKRENIELKKEALQEKVPDLIPEVKVEPSA